ncbi:MAG: cytochrome-c oxidase, cbb3-type subunit III [Rhizobiales bacterium]|nr:cytochrome-c oxidase, cbb3-type subunit III [Hyphomicrobiales bacterium]MBI3673198.1 cytochrome-c oxidase, cbb3-type subunit III [Hyphomicrobiales bacterium]
MSKIEKDEISGVDTTGHEWDGIKELNHPLPRWWVMTFYATIVFAIGYTILYPAWPLLRGATPGVLGYSSRGDLDKSLEAAAASQKDLADKIAATPVAGIMKDEKLRAFATAAGAAAFKVNCVQCHGSGAAGAIGYPNLNDNDWLWGGSIDEIYATIGNGIRAPGNASTHASQMPNFGGDGILKPEQIADVANYVWTLSGGKPDDAAAATRGKQIYADNCAACHGDAGQGNKEFGAPNLADQIRLYSKNGSIKDIEAQVTRPRHGVMPAWGAKLGDTAVKELAVFVHSLGGGV